jgi:hypothetical protein
VLIGRPVQFVNVPDDGVPRAGVTNVADVSVGDVPKTKAPVPVSSVTAEIRLALEGVPRNVAIPAAKPEMPVETGSPVQFVSVPEDGVPKAGVTRVAEVSVGEVPKTNAPDPVSSESNAASPAEVVTEEMTPVPLATDITPVVREARACSALKLPFEVCVMYVASFGAFKPMISTAI